jgi:hypothetical protein
LVQGVTGFPAEAWHDFRMDCVGSIVSAWVDGVEIGSYDTENAQGGIALQVSGVTAVFDDVLVTPL